MRVRCVHWVVRHPHPTAPPGDDANKRDRADDCRDTADRCDEPEQRAPVAPIILIACRRACAGRLGEQVVGIGFGLVGDRRCSVGATGRGGGGERGRDGAVAERSVARVVLADLGRCQSGERLIVGRCPARGRVEDHPPNVGEEDFGPGVGVFTSHDVGAAGGIPLAPREADSDWVGMPIERAMAAKVEANCSQ